MTIADERIPAVARHAGHPLVIVGAGPAGLAAAAQAHARGIPTVVLESGTSAGSAVLEWGHVRLVLALVRAHRPGRREAADRERLDQPRPGVVPHRT